MTSIDTYKSKKEEMRRRIEEIDSLFTGEGDHLLYLYGFIPGGLKCHTCHSVHLDMHEGNRTATCLLCGKVSYLTAQTFFHGVRRALDWVRAIFLHEEGFSYSANMFSELTGMARSSVTEMHSKLWTVVSVQMESCSAESSSSFLSAINKRSLQTPAAKHPMTEQDVFDKIESENMAESLDSFIRRKLEEIYQNSDSTDSISTDSISPDSIAPDSIAPDSNTYGASWLNEKSVYHLLSSEPRSFESIGSAVGLNVGELSLTLVHLELAGLAKSLPGNAYIQKRPVWTDTSITAKSSERSKKSPFKQFFEFISQTFHGISRKYLQLYLAAFWCCTSRRRWEIGSLFRACFRSKRLTRRDRLAYVSPPVVAYCMPVESSTTVDCRRLSSRSLFHGSELSRKQIT